MKDLGIFWLMVILTGIYLVANVTSCFFIVKTRRLAMQC